MQPQAAPLPRPIATGIVAALLVCAAVAWLVTISQASSMGLGGMVMMSAALFLITWLVMMVAMMFPSVAPMVLAYASVTRARSERYVPTAAGVHPQPRLRPGRTVRSPRRRLTRPLLPGVLLGAHGRAGGDRPDEHRLDGRDRRGLLHREERALRGHAAARGGRRVRGRRPGGDRLALASGRP